MTELEIERETVVIVLRNADGQILMQHRTDDAPGWPGKWTRPEAVGETAKIENLTALPMRSEPRMPWEESPHPPADCYVVVPASANTVAKLALGIADNQALTSVCEAIGARRPPVVVFPRINAAHAGQPAWQDHIDALIATGVHLVYGDDVWPLHTPRSAPGRQLPWNEIRDAIHTAKAR